jgi:hypothetical protein
MLELSGWGPLIALWTVGAVHLTWIVRRESGSTRMETPHKKAA